MKIHIFSKDKKVHGEVWHDDGSPIKLKPSTEKTFIEKLDNYTSYNLGMLPPAVRWISLDKSIVVFERPPMKQLVEFLPYARDYIKENFDYRKAGSYCSYELNIPWTVYVCNFDATYLPVTVKVFARNTHITSMDDKLGLLPLLNFYNNGKLCNPATKIFEGMPTSLGEGINMAYNLVWNSGWNLDLRDALDLSWRCNMPFDSRSLKAVMLSSYTQAELLAKEKAGSQGTNTVSFFKTWAKFGMNEILNRQWTTPCTEVKGAQPPKGLTLSQAIGYAQTELYTSQSTQNRTFLVNIASALM